MSRTRAAYSMVPGVQNDTGDPVLLFVRDGCSLVARTREREWVRALAMRTVEQCGCAPHIQGCREYAGGLFPFPTDRTRATYLRGAL